MSFRRPLPQAGVAKSTEANPNDQASIGLPLSVVLQVGKEHNTSIGMLGGGSSEEMVTVDDYGNNAEKRFKNNSPQDANHQAWKSIATDFHVLMGGRLYSDPVYKWPRMLNRDALLQAIGYYNDGDPVLGLLNASVTEGLAVFSTGMRLESPSVQVVRLWGFAGCTQWDQQSGQVYREAAMQIARGLPQGTTEIVIQYDGDACWEKEDEKFSHNIMVGYVSQIIQETAPSVKKVHLLITKLDSPKKQLKDIAEKFGELSDTNLTPGTTLTLRTDKTKSTPGQPKHYYPNHTVRGEGRRGFFDSISLFVSRGYTGGASEPQNMAMVSRFLQDATMPLRDAYTRQAETLKETKYYYDTNYDDPGAYRDGLLMETKIMQLEAAARALPLWHCICVGGNTEKGLEAVIRAGYGFQSVARSFLAARG